MSNGLVDQSEEFDIEPNHYGVCWKYLKWNLNIDNNEAIEICKVCDMCPNSPVYNNEVNLDEMIYAYKNGEFEVEVEVEDEDEDEDEIDDDEFENEEIYDPYSETPFKGSDKINSNRLADYYSESSSKDSEFCVICQEAATEKCVSLNKCKHVFHKSCIDHWLTTCKSCCPLCNQSLEC